VLKLASSRFAQVVTSRYVDIQAGEEVLSMIANKKGGN